MRHVSFIQQLFIIILFCIAGTIGCVHHPATASEAVEAPPPAQSQQDVLVREARAEADSLRSELAAVKISAAKQQAQLSAARERAESLQAREEALASSMQHVKASLLSTETERDQLRQTNATLQAQSASLPGLQQLQSDVQNIQDSMHHMASNMERLMDEVILIKEDMSQSRRKQQSRTASLTAFSMTTPTPSNTQTQPWVVKPGDTLWHISNHHHVSVNALMELNQLPSDLIVEGQTLQVPVLVTEQADQEATPTQMLGPDSTSSDE
ncbi:MAG: LysM peptidoglycan-binding domain-containing protein [Nitrospirales bacterium]